MNLGIIAITVFVLWIGSEIILARTKRSQSTDRRFDRSSLRLLWITIALSVNIGVLLSFQRIGYFGNGSPLFPFAGLVLIVCGLFVRWLAIISLKHQFTVDISITRNHQLVTEGIYRFVRHPAYAGSLLSFFGLGLFFSNYLSLLIIILPICTAFLYRIRVEEKALLDHFGKEYINYCASTKRLIPGIF
jgi:protein-S-isoprenylcysteine O-methyltransferase Ste14